MEHLNSSDLQRTIAHFEAHDLGFTFPLRDEAYVLSQAPSSNWSNMDAWASFKAKVEMVRDSPALLGYYMCKLESTATLFASSKPQSGCTGDDCGPGRFPHEGAARVYSALKQLDPFHL